MSWTPPRRRALWPIVVAASLLALAGCGAIGATSSPTQGTASSRPTAAATATPLALAPTVDPASVPASCANSMMGPQPPLARVGNLLVSQAVVGISYAFNQIPQNAGDKPILADSTLSKPAVNPTMKGQGGYHFVICNASASQTTTLQSVSVRIASVAPYTGALSAWNPCRDSRYDALTKATIPGNCSGAAPSNEELQASFPSGASVGATVTATQVTAQPVTQNDPTPYPPLPLSLAPGQSSLMLVDVAPPTSPGTYTFALGLSVDASAPRYFSITNPILLAPVANEWNGQNCLTPAMQAQIPAATQDTYYVCPPAS